MSAVQVPSGILEEMCCLGVQSFRSSFCLSQHVQSDVSPELHVLGQCLLFRLYAHFPLCQVHVVTALTFY